MTFFDVADPAFAVTSDEVHRARERGWYARTSYGLAVLHYDQAARLIRHPSLRQGSWAWPAHHGITSGPFADWWAGWVLNKEGADHQRLRRLLNPAFSRRRIEALEPRLRALDAERLSETELRDTLVLLVFGGFDTTRNQLGLAMQAFIDRPGQWRLLARRPGLGPAAVEEVMRVSPTTTWVTREALEDFTFDGLAIKAGTTIHLFCESAGTDPRAGGDAGFDITAAGRPPHLAFGGGVHYCLGHLVARTDMSVALTVLARRLRNPWVSGPAQWLPCSGNTGPSRLPIAFTPGR